MPKRFPFAITFLLLTSLSVSRTGLAQTMRFKHYSTDEGFTGASFKTIVQDSLGFLWISSNSGLFRFDGYNFTAYKPNLNDSLSLPQEIVRRIWVDPFGRLWAGFPDLISYYDRDLDGFITCRVSLGDSPPETMCFENKETIWLGTLKKGLVRLNLTTQKIIAYSNGHDTERNTIREIKDEGQFLLLGTAKGLWKFDKEKKSFTRPVCNPADSLLLYSGNVTKVFSYKDHYWLWIDQRLVKVNSGFSVVQTLDFTMIHQRFDIEKSYKDALVKEIEKDAAGIFWIASQGLGLIRYDPGNNQLTNFRNDKSDENSLPTDVLNHVMIDRDKNIWVTTVNKGIVQVKKQSLHFYNHLQGISTTSIALLSAGNSNHLAVASQGAGLWTGSINSRRLDTLQFQKFEPLKKFRGFENLISLCRGKDNLWIGSFQSGILGLPINTQTGMIESNVIKRYQKDADNPYTISENFITGLLEDPRGHLWLGTYSTGLNVINPEREYGKEGSVFRYRHNSSDSTSIIDGGVPDMKPQDDHSLLIVAHGGLDLLRNPLLASDRLRFEHLFNNADCMRIIKALDGTLIIGTKSGLYEGSQEGNRYKFTKAPLPGNPFITSMQEDRLGRLWFSSYEGLFFYDRKAQISLVFKKEDGLPSSRTLSAAGSAQTPEGIMIFSNAEGLSLFDPLSLRINSTKPRPVITQLKVNNKIVSSSDRHNQATDFVIPHSINTLDELTLDYTQNILTLEFAAMDFTAPEKNLYDYKLEDFDNDWVHTDWKNRTATYTNLRPGDYIFKVKASNRDGIWNDYETTLKIHVLPPPWKTWWAYSLYGIAFASILFVARRNIIQRERLAAKLKLEHLELEKVQEIDKVKTNFFANISHEFRTPLTLIRGPAQNLLERFKKDKEAKDQLNLIQQNADRLLRLVSQILDLARLESGGLKKEISEGDLMSFLRTVAGSFSSLAIQKRISLVQQIPVGIIHARFDKDKLEKIFSNLVSNALKFTPENGAIIINASLATEGAQNEITKLFLHVTDTGKGVPADQIGKIFERFYQVSEDGSQNAGTGIGLALCKELAEFLGGSLTVESKVGEGSKFTLTLPIQVTPRTAPVSTTLIQEKDERPVDPGLNEPLDSLTTSLTVVDEEKPILLIVEDHTDLRKFIISCLGDEYQFLQAGDGEDGLGQAIDRVPALVLSDVMMPKMDGIEMCHKIKLDHRTSHIPVILLTAKATDESKLSGLGIGADDYLIKPFNKDELILKIRNQVSAQARMQEKIRLELLSESTTVKAVSADEIFLIRVKTIIEARISDEQLSVEGLAEEVALSRVQLYRKITALTGITVNEFIRKLRLQRGALLLQQNWGPVSQVAYEVGFSNPTYFSKCFKEHFGVLPSEYKAGLR